MNFAHIEAAVALDLQPGDDVAHYLKRFPGIDTRQWDVQEMLDGVQPGAKTDGAGVWYNPDGSSVAKDGTITTPIVIPTPTPPATTKQEILDILTLLNAAAAKLK